MFGRLAPFALLCALTIVGCGDDDDDGNSSATRYTSSCTNFCEAAHKCNSSNDVEQCRTTCNNELETSGPNFNTDYLTALDECIAEVTCAELRLNAIIGTCDARARVQVAATDVVVAFCDDVEEQDLKCSRQLRPFCAEGLKVFSDRAIQDSQHCLAEPCDLQEPCVEEVLGVTL